MRITAIRLCFVLTFLSASWMVSAQTTASSWYLEVPGLDVSRYTTLHQSLEEHSRFVMSEACVPAHLIGVSLRAGLTPTPEDPEVILQLFVSRGFPQATHLSESSPAVFMERCRSARLGN
jgi:hypothetical protein